MYEKGTLLALRFTGVDESVTSLVSPVDFVASAAVALAFAAGMAAVDESVSSLVSPVDFVASAAVALALAQASFENDADLDVSVKYNYKERFSELAKVQKNRKAIV